MTAIEPVSAVQSSQAPSLLSSSLLLGGTEASSGLNFSDMLTKGVSQVEAKLDAADVMVRKFAVDDSIPVHQVTIALEEARLAVEMAVQLRNKVVEGYREIMNMQL